MEGLEKAQLLLQKGASGIIAVIGVKLTVVDADSTTYPGVLAVAVGGFLLVAAATIEYLVWSDKGTVVREMNKRALDALESWLRSKPGG